MNQFSNQEKLQDLKRRQTLLAAEADDLEQSLILAAIARVRRVVHEQAAAIPEMDERRLLEHVAEAMDMQIQFEYLQPMAVEELLKLAKPIG